MSSQPFDSNLMEFEEPQSRADSNLSSEEVMDRIEDVMASVLEQMNDERLPHISSDKLSKRFTLAQSRSFTSILMVLSYCHSLLAAGRSTTTREVYYFFVTHFRHQRECEQAIWDVCELLQVPRLSLGLTASPKGWFCGSLKIIRNTLVTDASALSSVHGLPVTREWLESERDFSLKTTAKFILVIEKEGIYTRLSEDRFFERVPCILVTGKGYPDLATRALVHTLYQQFALPVYGICDCNPHGLGVLQTYRRGNERLGVDGGDRYSVPIQWLGLKPSQVQLLQLPQPVYQTMTDYDLKKLESIMQDLYFDDEELGAMQTQGYKVELEALQWLGMNHLSDWLEDKSLGL